MRSYLIRSSRYSSLVYLTGCIAFFLMLANCGLSKALGADVTTKGQVFSGSAEGGYVFDTGLLQGKITPGQRTLGLTSLVHAPSGFKLDGAYGILSYYRVFTTNRRYGHAGWDWPCESKVDSLGQVQIYWPENDEHPFDMSAAYRLVDNRTVDVETSVKALENLEDFEVFMASYFSSGLPGPYVYVGVNPEKGGKPGFMLAKKTYGDWQVYPRNDGVVPMIRDGRWTKEPNPVNWIERPKLAGPVCLRRGDKETPVVILMSPPGDCFAISTPYEGEGHYSLYLSLFGRDIKAGQVDKARCRLIVADEISDEQIQVLYEKYIADLSERKLKP